ncbi:hypothetical protein BDP81DRAFT_415331 [Colletotrichum phormii]|uniref:Uncharacterized protein n=1 Tax=Colletotrichum phormii TaxID=359342 RepID=A0AAJ0A386_9PEZI|nr:uncharacterized protein BDP81DRAFT_415331 [Colletotrichum phormii]KAK1654266.1 hypothetical protein BDP81DRAFT_415331 [Colletotrichum phormii]
MVRRRWSETGHVEMGGTDVVEPTIMDSEYEHRSDNFSSASVHGLVECSEPRGRSPNGDLSRRRTDADGCTSYVDERDWTRAVWYAVRRLLYNLLGIRRQQSCGRPENETRPGRGGGWVSVGGGSVDVDFAARHSLDRQRSEVSLAITIS